MVRIIWSVEQEGNPVVTEQEINRAVTAFSQDLTSVARSTEKFAKRYGEVIVGKHQENVDVTTHTDTGTKIEDVKILGVDRGEPHYKKFMESLKKAGVMPPDTKDVGVPLEHDQFVKKLQDRPDF